MSDSLRNLIKLLVEEYVSSLPSKHSIISPAAKKAKVSEIPSPRIAGRALTPVDRNSHQLSKSKPESKDAVKKELSDDKIKDIVRRHNITSQNCLDMLSSNKDLRKELGLGDIHMKNSDYYKRIYRIVANEAN